ncbi:metallophosphoesterase [Nocardia callitridis]|uniref:Metallophosphoesterase n=1 Tax=Nocardia callitridis TaxID=648753 RepID=A0ABP9KQ71_9NOCA
MRLVFAVALLIVLSVFVHRRFVSAPRLPRRVGVAVDVLLAVMLVLAVIGFGSGQAFDPAWASVPGFIGMTWLAVGLYLILGSLVLGVVLLVIRGISRVGHKDSSTIRLTVTRVGAAVVVVASVATVGYGLVAAAHPKVTETTVAVHRLPRAFDGLRVALVADVHAGPTRGADFVRRIVEQVNAQHPDLVILDGDLTDGTVELVGEVLAPLRELHAPLGVFAVSGNHEFYADDGGAWMDLWSTLDVRVLRNERVTLDRDGSSIDLAGINDATAPAPYEPDLAAALADRTPDRFVLLLAHQPLQAMKASDFDVDLQVSGHTHAGQLWPLRYLVPLQQPSVEGLDKVGKTTLFTTRGAGAWGPPVRVGAQPEISMLTLRTP